MKQEDLNGMMRSPGEAKTAPAPAELPRCPECGERYLGDGMALCTECAALGAQPAVNGYTCTVPDDCETLHWRGQILSTNELASVAQPAAGEEMRLGAD